MGDGASAAGRSQAGCRHGALLNPASTLPATRLFRFIKSQPVRDADHPADRSGREQIFYWVSAPNVVPLVVTNRTGNEIAPVVCRWLVGSLPRATVTGCSPKANAASRMASLVWRRGVRTFVAAPRGQTSRSFFIGALAAAPGSVAMLRASPAVFPSRELHGFERVALPLHFLLNAHAVVLSNLRLS